MKNLILILLLFSSCGPSQRDYDKVQAEAVQLRSQLDDCQNGATRILNRIRDSFEHRLYDSVLVDTDRLLQHHPGSVEAKEAQEFGIKAHQVLQQVATLAEKEAEEQRLKSAQSAKEKARSLIRVREVRASHPNSAGGVDLEVIWQNRSSKIIKYAVFTAEPYNSVDDKVECTVRNRSAFRARVTGPVRAGEWRGENTVWECAWYNHSIVKAKLVEIELEYMDGSTATISIADIQLVLY